MEEAVKEATVVEKKVFHCFPIREQDSPFLKSRTSVREIVFDYQVFRLLRIYKRRHICIFCSDDREGLRDHAENKLKMVVLGDKGYTGTSLLEDMRTKGLCLMSLKPSNYKANWPRAIRQIIFRFRRRVETVFSQLSDQLNAEKVQAKSFRGLCTRLQNKILAHNLCMAFNSVFKNPFDMGKIKELIILKNFP